MGTAVAALTAFYSFRIIFLAFHGKFRGTYEQEHHLHESPKVMTIPLIILAIGAISAGWVGIPAALGGSNAIARFFEPVLGHPHVTAAHEEEFMVMGISIAAAIGGIFVSWIFYSLKPEIPKTLAAKFKGIYTTLWNKYYVDEIYDFIIVRPTKWIASSILVAVTDGKIIEGIVNGVPGAIRNFGERLRKLQTGHLQHYAISMALGLFVILTLVLIATGK
jgi:NADH-quinone oxidoreductase subunit L